MPDIAIGAVVAAAIAGLVSLLGLIIAKEQKISEFRQIWIDSLRAEIATFLTNLNSIVDEIGVEHASHAEKVKALSPHYSAVNKSTFDVALRLNATEDKSKRVINAMREFLKLASDDANMTPANMRPLEAELLLAAQVLLKSEWRRVKRGEVTFTIIKASSVMCIIFALAFIFNFASRNEPTAFQRPSNIIPSAPNSSGVSRDPLAGNVSLPAPHSSRPRR